MTVELQYDTWNPAKESLVAEDLQGQNGGRPDMPFNSQVVWGLLRQEPVQQSRKSSEYKESVRQMIANLWATLAWFRRLGLTNLQLQTLIKDYPDTNLGELYKRNTDDLRTVMDDGKDFTVAVPSLAANL